MMRRVAILPVAVLLAGLIFSPARAAEESPAADRFREKIQPILEKYCYGCHGYGSSEGGRTLDEFASDEAMLARHQALVGGAQERPRPDDAAGRARSSRPTQSAKRSSTGSATDAFGIDPADPDPGHVTLRRLNRVEYRNTIRDLMGVDYDTAENFPPDDSGYGFDNIGDSLSLSPLLMEKYIQAAETIVAKAVPTEPKFPW